MADIEQMLREIFGESFSRVTQFQTEQIKKVTARVQELAREAVHEDVTRMTTEIADLRARVAKLEAERVQQAAEGLDSAV